MLTFYNLQWSKHFKNTHLIIRSKIVWIRNNILKVSRHWSNSKCNFQETKRGFWILRNMDVEKFAPKCLMFFPRSFQPIVIHMGYDLWHNCIQFITVRLSEWFILLCNRLRICVGSQCGKTRFLFVNVWQSLVSFPNILWTAN